jgi:hypothetical protein
MKMSHSFGIIGLVVAGACFGDVSTARAVPTPTSGYVAHHGTVCRGKTATDNTNLRYDQWGVMNTSTTASATVVCPVGVYKLAQTAFASALVWRDSGGTVSCTLKATDYQGFLRFSAKKSASASNPQTLSWSFDALEDTTAHIECTLPKASSTVAGAGAWVSYVRLDQ